MQDATATRLQAPANAFELGNIIGKIEDARISGSFTADCSNHGDAADSASSSMSTRLPLPIVSKARTTRRQVTTVSCLRSPPRPMTNYSFITLTRQGRDRGSISE
jgi:hypothetical protein